MLRTNPDSLRSCLCFQVFRLNFASDFFDLLLAKFHQVEITILKHHVHGRNNKTRLGVEPLTFRSWSSSKRLGLDLALEPQLFQVLSIFSLEKAGKYNLQ